ncbi:hypothetical protein [Photobacterium kishitanii]|uniref:Uncharacterized protein n=1 Tax=Photobacterium kishitanii TaxID=318456 RepID=A0A2T3KL25_9GAMM|nr:hypothetical protein [Photobacterium kishitanii]PSV00418.1 hypothetical protein C9J27_04620 [Photobacterium kishitanii]
MYYYNTITRMYHFNHKKAAEAGDDMLHNFTIVVDLMNQLCVYDKFDSLLHGSWALSFSERLCKPLPSGVYRTMSREEYAQILEVATDIVRLYYDIDMSTDHGTLILNVPYCDDENKKNTNEHNLKQLKIIIYYILADFNAFFGICPHPRKIRDMFESYQSDHNSQIKKGSDL